MLILFINVTCMVSVLLIDLKPGYNVIKINCNTVKWDQIIQHLFLSIVIVKCKTWICLSFCTFEILRNIAWLFCKIRSVHINHWAISDIKRWSEWYHIVISASDTRYRGLYAMKQTHKWFDDHEYPCLGLRRGVRTLQRITVDNKYTINWGYGSNPKT